MGVQRMTDLEFRAVIASKRSELASPDLERAILGTLLAHDDAASRVAFLRPDDFAFAEHAEIWRAIQELHAKGITATAHMLRDREGCGGFDYLLALANAWSGYRTTLESYAEEVRSLAVKRRLVDLAAEVIETTSPDPDIPGDEAAATVIRDLTSLAGEGIRQTPDNADIAEAIVHDLETDLPCFATGLPDLDFAMGGGLFAGKLYGVAARKKVGKTILLGTISYNLNQAGVKHLFIPLEMGSKEIEQRNIARALEFNSIRFLTRDNADLSKRVASYAVTTPRNTLYADSPGATLEALRATIARHVAGSRIKGVILDYWQLVGGKAPKETEEYHLRTVAQWLAEIARKERIFVLTAAQVNQDGNTRGGEGLKLACDQYFTLHRDKNAVGAWLEMEESRYTLYHHVGAESSPGLFLSGHGPHFTDAAEAARVHAHEGGGR